MRDEEGFERFVAARWSTFYRLAWLLTASESGAQDLLQTAMEKAYGAWPRIARMDAPDAYIRRIMVNSLTSQRRLVRCDATTGICEIALGPGYERGMDLSMYF